jgi:hypothetical protein
MVWNETRLSSGTIKFRVLSERVWNSGWGLFMDRFVFSYILELDRVLVSEQRR